MSVYFAFIASLPTAYGILRYVTVDDKNGDSLTGAKIQYSGSGDSDGWLSYPDCSGCPAQLLNRANTYMGTWHATSSNRQGNGLHNATITFHGSALYVQVIIPGLGHPLNGTDADYYFYDNGALVGSLQAGTPSVLDDGFKYNFTAYHNTTMPEGSHTFTVQAGHEGGPEALLLLDSFIYSFDDDATTATSSTSPTSATSVSSASSASPTFIATTTPKTAPESPKNGQTVVLAAVLSTVAVLIGVFVLLYMRHRKIVRSRASHRLSTYHSTSRLDDMGNELDFIVRPNTVHRSGQTISSMSRASTWVSSLPSYGVTRHDSLGNSSVPDSLPPPYTDLDGSVHGVEDGKTDHASQRQSLFNDGLR